jgi:hypothetical protein
MVIIAVPRKEKEKPGAESQQGAALNNLRDPRLLVGGVGTVADRPQAVEGCGVLARCVAVGGTADRRLVEFQPQALAEIPGLAP